MGKSHASGPKVVVLEKSSRQGVAHCKFCTCTTGAADPAYLQPGWGNLVPSVSARADKPQAKKRGGGGGRNNVK